MRLYQCRCGAPLYFANTQCLACGTAVGYDPAGDVMRPVDDGSDMVWCANGTQHQVCNWLTHFQGPPLCISCRLNHFIPDLSQSGSPALWHKMELAKRRMVHWLLFRGLPVVPRSENSRGLAFDFVLPQPGEHITTGHDAGLITLNLLEADESVRERNRHELGEPYRTLLGHFRHEIAHYYWWRWFDPADGSDLQWLPALRSLFGDEKADYAQAMQWYYTEGPPPDWPQHYISAYASMHPWEDWAETWAHYMHITDALETARSNSLRRSGTRLQAAPDHASLRLPEPFKKTKDVEFREMITAWMHLAPALNEMSLSLGHGDLYPFVPAPEVLQKLHCIHRMVKGG
jgi:hypothetical protein